METENNLRTNQTKFIDFLLASGALTFGDFITKSGRATPYFINTGNFNSGRKIFELGRFYAQHIVDRGLLEGLEVVFGPAYKGIPLCTTTAGALYSEHNCDVSFSFDRKEDKGHGDKGWLVGKQISQGMKVLIVEDVVTAGTTIREVVPQLREKTGAFVSSVVISVDRCERGQGEVSAVSELQQALAVAVYPIVTIHEIVTYLRGQRHIYPEFTEEIDQRLQVYLKEYGAER